MTEHKLTLIVTLRKDKPELPKETVDFKRIEVGTSVFCFDRAKTVVSYQIKASKSIVFLLTCHESPAIDKDSIKSDITERENATKVDALDQICSNTSCNRRHEDTKMTVVHFLYHSKYIFGVQLCVIW